MVEPRCMSREDSEARTLLEPGHSDDLESLRRNRLEAEHDRSTLRRTTGAITEFLPEVVHGCSQMRRSAKAALVLSVVGCLCIGAAWGPRWTTSTDDEHARQHAHTDDALRLQQDAQGIICRDTPGWANNWVNCRAEHGGNRPELCTPLGWTCKAYEEKRWCFSGHGQGFALGGLLNFPEKHCCICGGGHKDAQAEAIGPTCHTTVEGEACYQSVRWILTVGVFQHNASYPSLNSSSPLEDVQRTLHKQNPTLCPLPCVPTTQAPGCHTAVAGEECYTHVQWAIQYGIYQEPTWFPGLTGASSFEEFQNLIHTKNQFLCPAACAPTAISSSATCHTSQSGEACYERVMWVKTVGIWKHPYWYPNLTPNSDFEAFQAALMPQRLCPEPCRTVKSCHTAQAGDGCYERVSWLKYRGLYEHPDWYPSLNPHSSFEDIQKIVHLENATLCAIPCWSGSCHTSVPGEECFQRTWWLKEEGIYLHPTWYPGLTTNSPFEDFQVFAHKQNASLCPLPCGVTPLPTPAPTILIPTPIPTLPPPTMMPTIPLPTMMPTLPVSTLPPGTTQAPTPCHTAVEGEDCYNGVMFSLTQGVYGHPEWYSPLTSASTFEEFQSLIYSRNRTQCPWMPCPCHKAVDGGTCFVAVTWAMQEGIYAHPEWFPNLDQFSSFEAFQIAVHMQNRTACPQTPCQPPPKTCHTASPGEACYSAVLWAQNTGIHANPTWYPGLSVGSSFEEFQMFIYHHNRTLCPNEPCEPDQTCHTAEYGEACYETLQWDMSDGIHGHPEWYAGLNPVSSLEDFQMLKHRTNRSQCPRPPCMIDYQSYATPTFRQLPKTVIKGMAYGPSPLKVVDKLDNDDFMSIDAAPMWAKWGRGDLRIMHMMGANMVRTYGNDGRVIKRRFFDEAYKQGISINTGMSDWPFKQSPDRCLLDKYYCFNQTYRSYKRNLLNGFTINNFTTYHPALKVFTIMNEPELKIYPRNLICRAMITTFDAILQAEKDVGVTGNPVALTITFSFAKLSGPPALGQMMEFKRCMENPHAAPTLYSPINDVTTAYRTRFVNSFNTASPYFSVKKEFFDVYNTSGFWDANLMIPVFIGEYHSVRFPLKEDILNMSKMVSEYPFYLGYTFFEFSIRYDKGGSELEFGMFGLGNCEIMPFKFANKNFTVWDLTENFDRHSKSRDKMDMVLAEAFGGTADTSLLGNPHCGALKAL